MDTLCLIKKGSPATILRKCTPGASLHKKGNQLSRGPTKNAKIYHNQCNSQRESLDPLVATAFTLKVPEKVDLAKGDCEGHKYVPNSEIDPMTLFPKDHLPEPSFPLALYFPIGEQQRVLGAGLGFYSLEDPCGYVLLHSDGVAHFGTNALSSECLLFKRLLSWVLSISSLDNPAGC